VEGRALSSSNAALQQLHLARVNSHAACRPLHGVFPGVQVRRGSCRSRGGSGSWRRALPDGRLAYRLKRPLTDGRTVLIEVAACPH